MAVVNRRAVVDSGDVLADIGARLREALITRRVSAAEMAATVGVSRQYVYAVEAGRVNVTMDVAKAMAEAVGLEIVARPRRG
jgi:DNA-binding XRE family transcriptional regulator